MFLNFSALKALKVKRSQVFLQIYSDLERILANHKQKMVVLWKSWLLILWQEPVARRNMNAGPIWRTLDMPDVHLFFSSFSLYTYMRINISLWFLLLLCL